VSAEHRQTAAAWHGGESSRLYAYASTGTVLGGLDDEIEDCLAIVEHGELEIELDPVDEHQRLTALLHHVERELGKSRAEEVGGEHGRIAAAWWHQDALGGRATGDTAATARRLLQGIEEGDPAVLDMAPGWDQIASAAEVMAEAGWREPDLDDREAHDRWEAAQPGVCDVYASGFVDAFWEAVAEACRDELDDGTTEARRSAAVSDSQQGPASFGDRLADVRYLGALAGVAAAARSELGMSDPEAWAVISRRPHRFEPPACGEADVATVRALLSGERSGVPIDGGATDLPRSSEVPVEAVRAWEEGRDAVWLTALWTTAMQTLDLPEQAQFLEEVNEKRLVALYAASGADPVVPTQPYIRPVAPVTTDIPATPPGWVAHPIGQWQCHESEVVYDPRRTDVAVTSSHKTSVAASFESAGWEQQAIDGHRRLWVLDRAAATRSSLARVDEHARGTDLDPAATVVRELAL
jgi:hypothetical protein